LDAGFSLDQFKFKDYVDQVWQAFYALGDSEFSPTESESASLWERPSVIALKNIAEGETLTHLNIGIRRPSIGVRPEFFEELLNRRSVSALNKGRGIPPSFLK
jgi:sialic acid synthase SpsE